MKNSTGSVVTMEPVKAGHQIGIAWVSQAHGASVGFVYDEDMTPREAVKEMIGSFCAGNGMKPFGDEHFPEHLEEGYTEVVYEEIDAGEFLERFGGLPKREMCVFDEGGTVGNSKKALGFDDDFPLPNDDQSKGEMASAARRAGIAGLGLMVLVVAVFLAVCKVSAVLVGTSFAFAVSVLIFVAFVALGVAELFHLVPKLGRELYKKLYR